MKVYNISTTIIGEGDSITIINATSIGGRFWDFERKYLGAASARTLTETLSSKALLSRLKLLAMDAGISTRTAVNVATTVIDPEVGKTIHKNGEANIYLYAEEANEEDIKIEIYQIRAITNINVVVGDDEKTIVSGNNAEALFEALGKIC
jgi:hypothetical protein